MRPLFPAPNLYQLRLVLAGISPMIWRRLVILSETSLAQLHEYIQIAFDWSGEHLHSFRIHGKDYGISYLGGISFDDNPNIVRLSRFRLHLRESSRYEYDFTANWRVDIRLERILSADGQRIPPICSGGRRAAPGEEYTAPLEYLQRLDRHRYEFPFEEMDTIAGALRRWLDAGGDRRAISDVEEVGEAAERVTAYQEFQPDRFKRCEVNRKLLQAFVAGEGAAA
jgi:hypothetical protein